MINKPAATRPDASDNSMTEATSMALPTKQGEGGVGIIMVIISMVIMVLHLALPAEQGEGGVGIIMVIIVSIATATIIRINSLHKCLCGGYASSPKSGSRNDVRK